MDYDVHTTKKFLRKNRIQIVLALLGLIMFIAVVSHFIGSNNGDQNDKFLNEPKDTTPEAVTSSEEPNDKPKPLNQDKKPSPTETTIIDTYQILQSHVRNGQQYYTQGLLFKDSNTLIESAGLYGESAIQYLNLNDMTVGKQSKLDQKFFGEGCELYDNNGQEEIYQLTWRERKIIVWSAGDLTQRRIIDLPSDIREGWGIAKNIETDNKGNKVAVFYISDGSDTIFVVDPITFDIKRSFQVKKSDGTRVKSLNELEFVNGKLWANVYLTSDILVINPENGFVEYVIDLSKLKTLAQDKARKMKLPFRSDYVLNGIAYDQKNDKLIIAGKKWPLMWEIRVSGI